MITKHIRRVILFAMFIYLPFCSMAWGVLGHRIVGGIADGYLTKKAKKEIYKILGNESIAITSTWSDFVRSDPAYDYLDPWHYINIKGGVNEIDFRKKLAADTAIDAFTKLNQVIAKLKTGTLTPEEKLFNLRVLIHIVGDIHQPMHVARPEDRGGNGIKLQWFNSPTSLHTIWDSKLVDFQQLSYTEYVQSINFTTKLQRKEWQSESITDWIWQSYQYTEKIYAETKADANLSYDYNFKFIGILNQQLLKGGVRLAGLLNEIFG